MEFVTSQKCKFLLDDNISLLNSIPVVLSEVILRKIQAGEEFQESDLRHLEEEYELKKSNVQCIIETVSYLHKQLSRVILKPSDMKKYLIEHLNIEENKSHLLVNTWTEDVRNNFDLENKKKLQHVSWELNVDSASTFVRRESSLNATIQLKFGDKSLVDDVLMRLDEDETSYLFNTLENIQTKLDII